MVVPAETKGMSDNSKRLHEVSHLLRGSSRTGEELDGIALFSEIKDIAVDGNKAVFEFSTNTLLSQDVFQTCDAGQVGIFPDSADKWIPGCQTAIGGAFEALKELISLIPTEDKIVMDVVHNVLAPVQKIVESAASLASIGFFVCLGNLPGKTIVDPKDDDNMIVSLFD